VTPGFQSAHEVYCYILRMDKTIGNDTETALLALLWGRYRTWIDLGGSRENDGIIGGTASSVDTRHGAKGPEQEEQDLEVEVRCARSLPYFTAIESKATSSRVTKVAGRRVRSELSMQRASNHEHEREHTSLLLPVKEWI